MVITKMGSSAQNVLPPVLLVPAPRAVAVVSTRPPGIPPTQDAPARTASSKLETPSAPIAMPSV